MKRTFVYVYSLLILVGWLNGCQSQRDTDNAEDSELPAPTSVKPVFVIDKPVSNQLNTLLETYLAMKDSFVQSDTSAINRKTEAFLQSLTSLSAASLPEDAQSKWQNSQAMLSRAATTQRSVSSLDDKRAAFEDVSRLLYEVVNTFGAKATVYKQYCPMALNDKGAYWLSTNKEIRNPYFGDQMLSCGEVQEVLTFDQP